MKIVAEAHDAEELTRVTQLLHSKGIPTFGRSHGSRYQVHWKIFVCLDEQFEDAAAVLQNPDHTPLLQVDVEAFLAEADARNLDAIADSARWTLALVALAVFLIFIVANSQTRGG